MIKLFILILLSPFFVKAQKIVENSYDKYDSVWKIKTSELKAKGLTIHAAYYNIEEEKFKDVGHNYFTVYFGFVARGVTSISENDSKVQVEFANGKVNSYDYKGSYKILSPGNYGSIYVEIENDDNVFFTEPIKSVRLSTTRETDDFEIKEKNSYFIINCLKLLKEEVSKGRLPVAVGR